MARSKKRAVKSVHLGLVLTVFVAGLGFVLFDKKHITTDLKSGDIVKADFSRDYRLRPYISVVKIAGVKVGVVTAAKQVSNQTVEIDMKINKGMTKVLGASPSAAVRSVTLLGGNYYVDLVPGGDRGVIDHSVIPQTATSVPVELDQVIGTFTPSVRSAVQADTDTTDDTLKNGGTPALQGIASSAPKALPPATDVFTALQGTAPKSDLENLVGGLESTSRQLTDTGVNLDQSLQGLNATSQTLADNSAQIAKVIGDGPAAMDSTQQGMTALRTSLDALEKTDRTAGPAVAKLNTLLDHATPALKAARPLVTDLQPLLGDLQVTVNQLVPTVNSSQTLLDDVKSPVIDRVSGPILSTVLSPYRGTTNFYKELAYMFAGMNATSMTTDGNGPMIDFQAGAGTQSINQVTDLLGLPALPTGVGSTTPPAATANTTDTAKTATANGRTQ